MKQHQCVDHFFVDRWPRGNVVSPTLSIIPPNAAWSLSVLSIPDQRALDFSLYRDDLPLLEAKSAVQHTDIPADIDGKSIVLVDDVLYTGRSIRAAMDALIDLGRPHSIQLAVLIDRGHREMPIRADYVGKNIPSARHEDIKVRLVETDGIDEVAITSPTNNKSTRSESKELEQLQRSYHGSDK